MDSEYKPTFFDSQLQNHQLQIMKTMIPYLSAGQQRPFALLIKYMELQKTAQLFSNDALTIQEVNSHSPQERMFQMLTDISEQCTPGYYGCLTGSCSLLPERTLCGCYSA